MPKNNGNVIKNDVKWIKKTLTGMDKKLDEVCTQVTVNKTKIEDHVSEHENDLKKTGLLAGIISVVIGLIGLVYRGG